VAAFGRRTSLGWISPNAARRRIYSIWLVAIAILAAGCAKKPSRTPEFRTITSDLVSAAKGAAGSRAEIVIRPETEKSSDGRTRVTADGIYIQLGDASKAPAVEGALARVADEYGLSRVQRSASAGVIRFDYFLGGRRTQSIRIITPLAASANSREAAGEYGARLAIIIDDMGIDPAAAETVLNFPVPVTLSVLPYQAHSSEIAEEAFRRGDEVMLHLPMQSENSAIRPESIELRVDTPTRDVDHILGEMLDSVPHAAGVNNHEGSLATADPQLMAALMASLRARNLFFIDSRTTAATVAYDAARQAGVPAAYRKVFLDDVETREAVLRQLDLAARDAARQGWCIAIGHPHPETLAALAEALPQLQAHGIHFVLASALAH
jgi:uncharacterized protein